MLDGVIGKIESKKAVIGVIGLGYVGIPLALRFSDVGFKVVGFDIDSDKIDILQSGRGYIKHINKDLIREAISNGFEATVDFTRISECDTILICVPTPLNKHKEPDLSFVTNTVDAILPHLGKGQIIALESTTYPGTTKEEVQPRIESMGFEVGKDIFVLYSPEREDPGNPSFCTQTIPKVCGGVTKACLEVGLCLYSQIIDQVVPVSSTCAAEFTKLLEIIHRAVNIGLVNEMKILADRMGIDVHEVIEAPSSKPFGFTPYYLGLGLGGHCIPIDPFYLTWKAKEYDLHTRFIELAGEINSSMPNYVVNKMVYALNDRGKSLKGSSILVLGIAYKKDVDDMRESPSVVIMDELQKLGATVSYSDPFVPSFPKMRKYHFPLESVELTDLSVASYDAVIIATNHSCFDYDLIKKSAKIVVDTRGVYKSRFETLVKA